MKRFLITVFVMVSMSLIAKSNQETLDVNKITKEVTFNFNKESRTVSVPVNPQRVVVIGFDTLDIVDALGYGDKVVGTVDPKGPMFPKYLKGYKDVASIGGLWGDDLETIAGLKPDLIIASARTFKNFDNLSEIAPSVYFNIPGMGFPYREKLYENIDSMAYIFDDVEAGDKLKQKLGDKFKEVITITSGLENTSALFLIITGKTIGLYSDNEKSRYGFVFNEYGFTSPASLEEIENDSAQHGNSVSYEFISAKNPNYLLVIDRGSATGESEVTAQDTLQNDLVATTNAAKNDNIIYLNATAWYIGNGGVTSTYTMIDDLLKKLK